MAAKKISSESTYRKAEDKTCIFLEIEIQKLGKDSYSYS